MIRFIKIMVSLAVWSMDMLWSLIVRLLGLEDGSRCVVINYHEIKAVHADSFRWQMDAILRWVNPIAAGGELPSGGGRRYVAITFDDALNCILDTAVPELLKRHIPFSVFVPTGYLGKTPEWIKGHPHNCGGLRVLTEEELNWLKKSGIVAIGSHCATHSNLLTLTQDQACAEIVESKQNLERLIGEEVELLSFPYGAFDLGHARLAKDAGYRRVFSILPKPFSSKPAPFVVGRVRVDPEDWRVEFFLKICGAYRWLPYAFWLKSKIIDLFGRKHSRLKDIAHKVYG
jgi:peptidoglycan/xylan/chitin deacetylase (PgdA/CDA1 family)